MENNTKERSINYDYMRVLMSFFVMGIHTTPWPDCFINSRILYYGIRAFLFPCNGVFYMISGRFNLFKNFECKKDYINYYINRFVSIVVPYGAVTCLLVLLNIIITRQVCNFNGYIYQCFEAFFSTNATKHFWFVCALIGILASAPFLSKMLKSMKDDELKVLFGVGIVWNIIAIYLVTDLGIGFGISGWFMWGWLFIFFLGYFCERIVNDRNIKLIYGLGILGFIVSVLGAIYLETFQYATDLSVGYIFYTMSCYLFLQRHIVINHRIIEYVLSPVIKYMAKYSFTAYLIHPFVLDNFTKRFVFPGDGVVQYLLSLLITFIASYIVSVAVFNILIRPLQIISARILRRFT